MSLGARVGLALALAVLAAGSARADIITYGFTFAVATDGFNQSAGDHFHSSTGGQYGNPAGKAEVGEFLTEQVRGLSEYNLAGLPPGRAYVTFNVYSDRGLFDGVNDFPFDGEIDILAYLGNNTEDLTDYQGPTTGFVTRFPTAGLRVGNVLSFDITEIYNDALLAGDPSLGLRLQFAAGTDPRGGAWVFDNFRLTTDDQTSGANVPEPATWAVLGALAVGGVWARRRVTRRPA